MRPRIAPKFFVMPALALVLCGAGLLGLKVAAADGAATPAPPPAPAAPQPAAAAPTIKLPDAAAPAGQAAPPAAAPAGQAPGGPPPAAKPSGPVPPEAMNGLSFEGLSEEQKKLAVAILNDNGCDCSCGMKLAVCRRDDSKCGRSLALANQVIDLVKKGKTAAEIVKAALTPPSKFVSFPLAAGSSPAIGPAGAKVTILHYLDYQ